MTEFDCTGEGYAIGDPEVDAMSEHYATQRARYFVVEDESGVAGAGGFGPLEGVDPAEGVAELRKMYFLPRLRGRGAGDRLLSTLLDAMRLAGFSRCYLETTSRMHAAQRLYLRHGFVEIDTPLGATGHGACDRFFARLLGSPPGHASAP